MFGKDELSNIDKAIVMNKICPNFVYIDSSSNNLVKNELASQGIEVISTVFTDWKELRSEATLFAKKIGINWLFVLDADEWLDPIDVDYISNIELEKDAYFVSFIMYFQGHRMRWVRHRPRIRLLSIDTSYFDSDYINEWVVAKSKGRLKKVLIKNDDSRTIYDQIHKQLIRANPQNYDGYKENQEHSGLKRFLVRIFQNLSCLAQAVIMFLYHYILRLGFLDGKYGLKYWLIYAFSFRYFLFLRQK